MEVAIFESVIIDDALIELEAEGKKYQGLYVEMNNAPERKYVKDKAALIAGLKKKVDRVRIDTAKAYKVEVEKQAAAIHARLDEANAPFQDLINDYNIERKKVLDAEKERKAQIERDIQLEADHELALLMNKTWAYDREQLLIEEQRIEAERLAEREEYAAEQVKLAEQRQIEQQKQDEQKRIDEENARLANIEHLKNVNNKALIDLQAFSGISEKQAKAVVTAIAKKQITNITINY